MAAVPGHEHFEARDFGKAGEIVDRHHRVVGGRERGRELFGYLARNGVLGDWREPDVIRISPAPLYNTHNDVLRFAQAVENWRHG